MKYTNKQILSIEESAKKRSKKLVHITDKSEFSTEDKMKLGLCKHFVQFLVTKKMKAKDLAKLMDIPVTRLSEISNYKFQKFTVDQLIKYLEVLAQHDKQIKEYLKLLSSVAEMSVKSVAVTKSLRKSVEQSIHA